jgi:hypothetical protein
MTVEAFITGVSALVGGNGGGGVWEDGVRTGFFFYSTFVVCWVGEWEIRVCFGFWLRFLVMS